MNAICWCAQSIRPSLPMARRRTPLASMARCAAVTSSGAAAGGRCEGARDPVPRGRYGRSGLHVRARSARWSRTLRDLRVRGCRGARGGSGLALEESPMKWLTEVIHDAVVARVDLWDRDDRDRLAEAIIEAIPKDIV